MHPLHYRDPGASGEEGLCCRCVEAPISRLGVFSSEISDLMLVPEITVICIVELVYE